MPSRLIANIETSGPLSADDRRAVASLVRGARRFQAGDDIVTEGQAQPHCRVLLTGYAFRHKTLEDGRRQILSFHIPGDVCDAQGLLLSMDYGVTALTGCEAGFMPHADLEAVLMRHPRVARGLRRMTLVEGAIFREWMVGMGRRTAYARIAHLFCELVVRLRAAGLAQGDRVRFPINQTHLSDALGLSVVHTNRVMQALRRDGLLSFRSGELIVRDWPGLQQAGEFDPGYLHLTASSS